MSAPFTFLVRAGVCSLMATVTSSLALAAVAHREGRGALQPLNATSHWLNGEQAAERRAADIKHTGVGAATHAAATFFWAVLFEAWIGPRRPRPAVPLIAQAAAMSAVAAAVDYLATPKRFTPGWEFVLSKRGMAIAYAAMAAGLAIGVAAPNPADVTVADPLPELPAGAFDKLDGGDDLAFYAPPRLVTHIDEDAVAALSGYYRTILPAGAAVLDLMSSWVSHLPPELALDQVIGHGMNTDELSANPRLTRRFVQDLNREPRLPLEDASLDAALCCVGVQYLQRPLEVFAEVGRALKPGAPFAVSFSNRCFPTKAVAIWQALDVAGQAGLVRLYLERSGFASTDTRVLADGSAGDPLVVVTGRA